MRQLLLLTCFFPPDNTPAAARPGQLYDYLPEHDYQPIVIASSSEGAPSEGEFIWRIPSSDEPASVRFASNLARWFMRFCAPYNDRLPWVPHAASAAVSLIKSRPVDAIYSTSPSLAAHFTALWLKARFGLPWIADFQDPVRDNPMRTRKWVYPYDAFVELSIFRYADRLIANTDTVAAAWRTRYPQWAHKISVLWNSFDPREQVETISPPPRDYRLLAHIGSLYGGRDPGMALSAFERLGADASSIRIRLVGPIETGILERRAALFERMRRSGVLEFNNTRVPREEAVRETAQADYLLLLDVNESNASFQVPSKLLDYIRYGKPILAFTPTGSPVERILVQSGVPFVTVAPDATEANCDQKLSEFLSLTTQRSQASAWFEETFSARTQARTLSRLLNGLLPPKTPSNSHNPIAAEQSSMLVL